MKKLLPLFISVVLGTTTSAYADTLAEIYEQAKENDPLLLSAKAERDAAFENITTSRSELLPQINLTAGYNLNRSDIDPRDSDKFTAGIRFSQELYNRSSWLTLDTSEKIARQADATYAATQQSLILRVAQGYFSVLRAQDNLEFIRAERSAVSRQLEQTKQRFDVGLSAITDVHDAQAQFDTVLADEVLAKNELANSFEALREITGQEHTKLSALDTYRFSATKTSNSTEELIQEAEEKNLSLIASLINLDIAKDRISLSDSGHLPSLTLDGGYNYGYDRNDAAQYSSSKEYNDFNIGVNLVVPLYTGGGIDSQTKQAEFAYVSASQDVERTYRGVVKDVRAHNNNINASIGALRAYQQSVISARSALEATEAGFDVGTRTIVDVLDSTRRLYSANKNLSNARYDYILSVLQLRQALGTLSEQDILDINEGLKGQKKSKTK